MIHKDTFTKDWILQFKDEPNYKKCDPALIEKMIFALYLLECLAHHPINFIFKGGTSLVLIMQESNRFSVDIDISCKISRNELEKILDKIVETSEFHSYSLDKNRSYENALIPKAHYFIYYKSDFNNNASYILLDVLFQENKYPDLQQIKIESNWLKTTEPYLLVKTPTINSMLGDKLTAFAPNTTGVPYFKHKELEIVKQLFDVALLIEKLDNLEEVFYSFVSNAQEGIAYRKLSINYNDVLDDIIKTARLISLREKNIGSKLTKFEEIKLGLTKMSSFTINRNFRIDDAIEASAKLSYLAIKLKNKDFRPLKKFDKHTDISIMQIMNNEYSYLNKLKKSNKKAFYYWHQCIENMNL